MRDDAADAARGVAARDHPRDELLQRLALPALDEQPVREAFLQAEDGFKLAALHRQQPREQRAEEALGRGDLCGKSRANGSVRRLGQGVPERGKVGLRFRELPADGRSARQGAERGFVIARTAPRNEQRLDARRIDANRAQVLDGEDVVGLVQQVRRKTARLLQDGGQGLGVRSARTQRLVERRLRLWRVDGARGLHERCKVRILRAESERVDAAEPLQQAHAAAREVLRTAAGKEERQLQDKLTAAAHRKIRAAPLVKDGRLPALREAAAHHRDDGRLVMEALADGPELVGVALMKRIVFGDDANDMHGEGSFRKN